MTGLPSALASRQRRNILDDATQGLGASRGAHISIRGGRFRLIGATGAETLLETHYIDVIAIDANRNPARVYFEGDYDLTADIPPVCFSDNGTGPSTQAMQPQAPSCAVCSRNIRGSDVTFSGKPTTACDNRKKIAVIIPDDPAVNVYEFQIPPGSLTNFRAYAKWLTEQASGVEGRRMDIADVVTRVQFDPDKQFVMQFQAVAFADDDRTLQLIRYIDANGLSDAAVGRNDVACDPEVVKQFTLPPRPAQQQEVIPPPPVNRGRGRRASAGQQEAAPSAAAPFIAPAQGNGAPSTQFAPAVASSATVGVSANVSPSNEDIPDFLKRTNPNVPPAPVSPPRFGVGTAPPPPAAIQSAINEAMALPTRR